MEKPEIQHMVVIDTGIFSVDGLKKQEDGLEQRFRLLIIQVHFPIRVNISVFHVYLDISIY